MIPGYKEKEPGLYVSGKKAMIAYKFTFPDFPPVINLLVKAAREPEKYNLRIHEILPDHAELLARSDSRLISAIMSEPLDPEFHPGEWLKVAGYKSVFLAQGTLALSKSRPAYRRDRAAEWHTVPEIKDGVVSELEFIARQSDLNPELARQLQEADTSNLYDLSHNVLYQLAGKIIRELGDVRIKHDILDAVKNLPEPKEGVVIPFRRD